jgi:AraC-like DNA-binding protein
MDDDRLALLCPLSSGAPMVDRVRLAASSTLPLDARGPVDVHVVLRGSARWGHITFGEGDVLIVRGARALSDGSSTAANDGGAETLRARYRADRFVMPPSRSGAKVLHVPATTVASDPRVSSLVALLKSEVSDRTLSSRLFDALFVAIERRQAPLPFPLADARLARTIAELHTRHAERWTVASMAKHAGMSRAAFARRFAELTGMPPHAYLERLRMNVARTLLSQRYEPVAEIAQRVGYRSESVFSRAFKRIVGLPPAIFRRRSRITATTMTRAAA